MNEEAMEEALRRALRPVDPGAGFTARVMQRVGSQEPARSAGPSLRWWPASSTSLSLPRWSAALLLAIVLACGLGLLHWRHEAQEWQRGLDARAQLLEALNIASSDVNVARSLVLAEEQPQP